MSLWSYEMYFAPDHLCHLTKIFAEFAHHNMTEVMLRDIQPSNVHYTYYTSTS